MILFFHLICLFTHYIVSNISKSISKFRGVPRKDLEGANDCTACKSSSFFSDTEGYVNGSYDACDGNLKFFPPVYAQRYEAVALILQEPKWKGKIKKVVDFGCAELGFFMYLKNIPGIEEILEVDIDMQLIEKYANKVAPLTTDYISFKRTNPLNVYLLSGSISDYDERLKSIDAVVVIEVIEHLYPDVLDKMPYNIFHLIKPRLAIFTTPNAEFNVLFLNFVGFRHDDHKFEWTRKEFYDWTRRIIAAYPEYSVSFYGIGAGPKGTENFGCCSQMAVFERSEKFTLPNDIEKFSGVQKYKLIREYKYPYYPDSRTDETKTVDEVTYQLSRLTSTETYYNFDHCIFEVPLTYILDYVKQWCNSLEELRDILSSNGMTIEERNGEYLVLYSQESSSSSSSSSNFSEEDYEDERREFRNERREFDEPDFWDDNFNISEKRSPSPGARDESALKSVNLSKPSGDFSDLCEENDGPLNLEAKKPASYREFKSSKRKSFNETEAEDLSTVGQNRFDEKPENREIVIKKELQSKIPRKRNFHEVHKKIPSPLNSPSQFRSKNRARPHSSYVRKSPRKMSKSCSLDSCLENINCEPVEVQALYLNLISGGTFPSPSSLSVNSHGDSSKFLINDSSSPLVDSSSYERAVDSGYPFSFSPHDLTPEQVDELLTENEIMISSRSTTSEDSLTEDDEELMVEEPRIVRDLFVDEVIVENGDLANNNRDGEGNNVEGIAGERIAILAPDPNDNNVLMLLPERENPFPEWLLNLVGIAQ